MKQFETLLRSYFNYGSNWSFYSMLTCNQILKIECNFWIQFLEPSCYNIINQDWAFGSSSTIKLCSRSCQQLSGIIFLHRFWHRFWNRYRLWNKHWRRGWNLKKELAFFQTKKIYYLSFRNS